MVEKKLSKYYWIAGVVIITVIILILSFVVAINPSLKSIGKTNKELKEKQEELKVSEEKLEKLKELKVKEDELREQSRVVFRAIPNKKEIGDAFIQLDGLISESGGNSAEASGNNSSSTGSTGSSSGTSIVQSPAGVSSLTYETDVTFPNYQNFKSMLSNTENALRFVYLSNLKITKANPFTASLTYTAYYRDEKSPDATGENGADK
ncbi:hypothetical protein C4544_02510 [candidate division WS5 bacterium]|uniref:Type 4a pilus biogenesis protein PilO n=1 Tax=candidate division WS5 bacterium TaxID=2093353 RepID=A0A419DES6_9BACT|nr:MAG: hypothetical protein C4544_02510 [candidate division WS5 bacterium]